MTVVIYSCLESDNDEILKFNTNNSSYFKISASLLILTLQ